MKFLIEFALNDNDKRLLIVLLFILVFLFLIIGLLGALIRFITIKFGERMNYEVHDAVIYRVISTPEQLKKYGHIKNNRYLVKKSVVPFLIALVSLVVWIIYSTITGIWARDYFADFGTLFYNFDWSNSDNYATLWGMTLLARWPDVISSPTWYNELWGSYILVPLWLTSIIWYAVVIQGYLARALKLNKLAHSIFEKNLDDFNYFDDVKNSSGPLPPKKNENENQNKPQ